MKAGERKKYLEAFDKYGDAIYRFCFFKVYSRGRAEELAQETFMKTWQYLREGNTVENIRAFLYRTATNLIIDDSRRKKEESLDAAMEESDAYEPSYDGAKEIQTKAVLKEVIGMMEYLEEEERQILTLRYLEDLDPKNIAEILHITPNNASVRINRALEKLKRRADKK